MEFEWDAAKAASNVEKYGVVFEVAYDFDWQTALVAADGRRDYGEVRFRATGRDVEGVFLAIVFTLRGDRVRIISARRANQKEVRAWQHERGM